MRTEPQAAPTAAHYGPSACVRPDNLCDGHQGSVEKRQPACPHPNVIPAKAGIHASFRRYDDAGTSPGGHDA